MSSKPIISFRVENVRQDGVSAVDVIASVVLLVFAYVVITYALSCVLKIGCVFVGVEFTWLLLMVIALVIEIVLCTI